MGRLNNGLSLIYAIEVSSDENRLITTKKITQKTNEKTTLLGYSVAFGALLASCTVNGG